MIVDQTVDLTAADISQAARGHAIDIDLVEDGERTVHVPCCPEVLLPPGRELRIPLETIDCFPLCEWCLVQLSTPSLGSVVRLGADIACVSRGVGTPSAAWVVALDGLAASHRELVCEFHPALAGFGHTLHRMNRRAMRNLHAAALPDSPGGRTLRRSGMRIAGLEATAAVLSGHTRPDPDWRGLVDAIVATAPIEGERLASLLLSVADWEATRIVARPPGQREWQHVGNPPVNPERRLLDLTDLEPDSLEAMAAELVIGDLLRLLTDLDLHGVDPTPAAVIRIDDGPRLTSPSRAITWRRGRIHWLRGLIDLGIIGVPDERTGPGHSVRVPPVVAAALSLPTGVAGASPVRASAHHPGG